MMWISNSLAIVLTSILLVQSSAARSDTQGSRNRVYRRPRAIGDATPAQVIGATYVASSIIAVSTCGTAGNTTSCLVYDVTAGFNNSLTFAENFVAITAQIQVLIASNGGDTTIPLEMLKAILPQPPTIDQIAAGDFYVAPIINAITGAIIIAVRPQVSTTSSSTPAATLAEVMPATSSTDYTTTTPAAIQQQPPTSTPVQQPASSSAAASVVIVVPASSSSSPIVVAASSTINTYTPPASSADASTYTPPSSTAASAYNSVTSSYVASTYYPASSSATNTYVSSTYVAATSTYTPPMSSASNIPASSTYVPSASTLTSSSSTVDQAVPAPPTSTSGSVPAPATSTSEVIKVTSTPTTSTSSTISTSSSSTPEQAPTSSSSSSSIAVVPSSTSTSTTSTTASLASTTAETTTPGTTTVSTSSTTSSSSSSAASSSPSGAPDSSYQTPNTTLVGTIAVTYSTDRTLRYLSGEGFTTDQYGQESAFSILTYQDECAEYNNNTLNAVSLSTTGSDGTIFYLGFDMTSASNSTSFDYSQKYAQPSSNTQIFLIDCMTKAISINSDAGLVICTNNDSLFVTDVDCVAAGGQATNPEFTFIPTSSYFSTFNGYSLA